MPRWTDLAAAAACALAVAAFGLGIAASLPSAAQPVGLDPRTVQGERVELRGGVRVSLTDEVLGPAEAFEAGLLRISPSPELLDAGPQSATFALRGPSRVSLDTDPLVDRWLVAPSEARAALGSTLVAAPLPAAGAALPWRLGGVTCLSLTLALLAAPRVIERRRSEAERLRCSVGASVAVATAALQADPAAPPGMAARLEALNASAVELAAAWHSAEARRRRLPQSEAAVRKPAVDALLVALRELEATAAAFAAPARARAWAELEAELGIALDAATRRAAAVHRASEASAAAAAELAALDRPRNTRSEPSP